MSGHRQTRSPRFFVCATTVTSIAGAAVAAAAGGCSLGFSSSDFTGGIEEDAGTSDATDTPEAASTSDGGPVADGSPEAGGALDQGLLGYWSFDEAQGSVAKDSSPNHNDGTVTGATWTTGKVGSALAFDGMGGNVTVPYRPSLGVTSAFSVAFWANLDAVSYDQRVYSQGYAFSLKMNSRRPQLNVGAAYATVNQSVPAGEWHHLVIVFDQGTATWYVDGVHVGNNPSTFVGDETVGPDPTDIKIGSTQDGSSSAKGALDEVRLYDRSLTAVEIETLASQ